MLSMLLSDRKKEKIVLPMWCLHSVGQTICKTRKEVQEVPGTTQGGLPSPGSWRDLPWYWGCFLGENIAN